MVVVSGQPHEVEVKLRPTVSRAVCLGVGPSFGAHDLKISLKWGAPLRRENGSAIFIAENFVSGRSTSTEGFSALWLRSKCGDDWFLCLIVFGIPNGVQSPETH